MGQKIQLSESQLHNLIKESVKKAIMNEISSDMLQRARNKFSEKYRNLPKGTLDRDEYGNPLHPKDKRAMFDHYRDFDRAIANAKRDEAMRDPMVRKAMELYQDVDWEQEVEDVDGGYASGYVWGEIEDEEGGVWQFQASAGFNWEGDWALDDIHDVEFTAPDGTTGSLPV